MCVCVNIVLSHKLMCQCGADATTMGQYFGATVKCNDCVVCTLYHVVRHGAVYTTILVHLHEYAIWTTNILYFFVARSSFATYNNSVSLWPQHIRHWISVMSAQYRAKRVFAPWISRREIRVSVAHRYCHSGIIAYLPRKGTARIKGRWFRLISPFSHIHTTWHAEWYSG